MVSRYYARPTGLPSGQRIAVFLPIIDRDPLEKFRKILRAVISGGRIEASYKYTYRTGRTEPIASKRRRQFDARILK